MALHIVGPGMRVTRILSFALIGATVCFTALEAQSLRGGATPAEFPPASFQGKQYVDSRGCVFIRAGISGNVTWVPRVSRERKQLCGFKPTVVSGATPAPATTPRNVEEITLAPTPTPAPKTAAKQVVVPVVKPAPKAVRTVAPAAVTTAAVVTPLQPAPRTVRTTKTTTQRPTPNTSATAASTVRTVPKVKPVATTAKAQSIASIPANARITPLHVYNNSHNTRISSVPKGYKPVWKDDRLNPHRAERTIKPSVVKRGVTVPSGYKLALRGDGRLNLNRGGRSAQGDAQTDMIWSNTVPRKLIPRENTRQVYKLPRENARSAAESPEPFTVKIAADNDLSTQPTSGLLRGGSDR